jgi:shikimate dehydrogenase
MKKYGLIGYPLKNNFSVNYYTEKFKQLNLNDYSYENFSLENIEDLIPLIDNNPDLLGLNITIPHKISIIKYMDELDESAQAAGAVNCVKILRSAQLTVDNRQLTENKNHKLIGYNTDVYGFEKSLSSFLSDEKKFDTALILGTGGAAKAVAFVLQNMNIDFSFVTRNIKHQTSNTKQFAYEKLDEKILAEHPLIINCTPVGMFPNINEVPPIPYQYITPQHFAFDLIYHPSETLFLKYFRECGAKTKNGLEMLHFQADKAWEIFRI